jgi:hypothetical protein
MTEYTSRTTPDQILVEDGAGNVYATFPRSRGGDYMFNTLADGLVADGHKVWDQNKSKYHPKQD